MLSLPITGPRGYSDAILKHWDTPLYLMKVGSKFDPNGYNWQKFDLARVFVPITEQDWDRYTFRQCAVEVEYFSDSAFFPHLGKRLRKFRYVGYNRYGISRGDINHRFDAHDRIWAPAYYDDLNEYVKDAAVPVRVPGLEVHDRCAEVVTPVFLAHMFNTDEDIIIVAGMIFHKRGTVGNLAYLAARWDDDDFKFPKVLDMSEEVSDDTIERVGDSWLFLATLYKFAQLTIPLEPWLKGVSVPDADFGVESREWLQDRIDYFVRGIKDIKFIDKMIDIDIDADLAYRMAP
jgi:hypothetical protein